MREALSDALVKLASEDPKVILLTGDHGYALFDDFRKIHPDKYINAGIAEQNMVGVAAGLAKNGFRPIVYGLSAFVPIRVLEQIKIDVAHDALPVIFLGDGAGFVYSHLGTSHQSTEDISALRAVPNIEILSPGDRFEMTASLNHAYKRHTPVYVRIGKADLGDIHTEIPKFDAEKLLPITKNAFTNHGIVFIGTGSMALVAKRLANNSFEDASAWSAPDITGIPTEALVDLAKRASLVVVLEEHSINGGLGSAVAEILSEHYPVRVLRIGVDNMFSKTCGTYQHLLMEHGLDDESIVRKIKSYLSIELVAG